MSSDDNRVAASDIVWTLVATGTWDNSNLEKQALWDAIPARRIALWNLRPSYSYTPGTNSDAASAAEINVLGSYVQCPGAGACLPHVLARPACASDARWQSWGTQGIW